MKSKTTKRKRRGGVRAVAAKIARDLFTCDATGERAAWVKHFNERHDYIGWAWSEHEMADRIEKHLNDSLFTLTPTRAARRRSKSK